MYYSNRTADEAIGKTDKEWKRMAALAVIIREGRCSPAWGDKQSEKFTGIFSRLLTDPIEQVQHEAKRGKHDA